MAYQTLAYRKQDKFGFVTLKQPTLSRLTALEMAELAAEVNSDKDVRVVIITGAGAEFSTGTDWKSVTEEEKNAPLWLIAESVARIQTPVIAAINGSAIGQGLELALACDLRFAAEGVKLGLDQITHNMIPWDGGTQRLPRLVNRARAMEMLMFGETIDAAEALRIGLVNKVVPADKLESAVLEMAGKIAANGPLALRYAKEAVSNGLDMTLDQGLHLEADLYMLLQTTDDRIEGVTSFLEKRAPDFKGH
uniref:Enoyl-CoA hydratase/isomerase family protein n=1 Tax=uncultured Dehalococcoidia bacterium TaxID=498747 RepID=A0A871XZ72_9CHLR|nr:Enoyl-CoA hydratase/isomerase family protein [uncultured Dehalococcoidia bacterium]